MLHEQSRILQRFLFVGDLAMIAIGWIAAYYLRFEILPPWFPLPLWRPLTRYLPYLVPVLTIWGTVFVFSGLYSTVRALRLTSMMYAVARAVFMGAAASVAAMFFYREFSFSRLHMVLFGGATSFLMVMLRLGLYVYAKNMRLRGKNVQRIIIVGAGNVGRRLSKTLSEYPLVRFDVMGFLDDRMKGSDILGKALDLPQLLDKQLAKNEPVTAVYLTLPLGASEITESLLRSLSTRLAHVYMIPDLFQFDLLNSRVSEIAGLPVLHLIDETPLRFDKIAKRLVDMAFSAGFLLVISPMLTVIALAVKLSSPGPVFYRQVRMGLNGRTFEMLKFRSMPVNAESNTGAVWAKKEDHRATKVGMFLRATSLDELPQFINVLKGDMSIVGPRPERPVFINDFKDKVPGYMLRHKMKAGITGWAQVNGWRGNTSIEKRIEHDLYYIQNWSLRLDFKIMFMTFWKGFINKNAY